MAETNKENNWTEFIGPGSAYTVMEAYKRSEADASGQKPVFIKPDAEQKKKMRSLN